MTEEKNANTVTVHDMQLSPEVAACYRFTEFQLKLAQEYGEAASLAGLIIASAIAQATGFPKHIADDVSERVATGLAKYEVARAVQTEPAGEA